MCDSCGCLTCSGYGTLSVSGVCSDCGEKPDHCVCEPVDEELEYDEEQDGDDDDGEEEEEEYEDYDYDEDDEKDW